MRVVVTDRGLSEGSDPFGDVVEESGGTVTYADCETEKEVLDRCRGADVVLTFVAPLTRDVLANLDVEHVIRMGTGFDNVDVKAATEYGIPVSNVPGYATEEVSEHAITLMLAAARTVAYSDRELRAGDGWGDTSPITPMYGKTFGVFGLGRIGRAVVPKARGLGMDVVATDPYLPADVFSALDVERVGFEDLLDVSDCVSVHAPLTDETRHRFDADAFRAMGEDAFLVNTARGPIVDGNALVEAIERGEIGGAGLDVYESEPPDSSPVKGCDRIVCSPHQAARCESAIERYTRIIRAELGRVLRGDRPRNLVNPEVRKYGNGVGRR